MTHLIDILIDASCRSGRDVLVRDLSTKPVDLSCSGIALDRGGLLLLGARNAAGASTVETVRDLRRRNPCLLVFVCVGAEHSLVRETPSFACAGADRVLAIDSGHGVANLVQLVLERVVAPPAETELRTISGLNFGPRVLQWVQYAIRNAYRPAHVADVARGIGFSVRTINEDLQNHDLPSFRDLWRCGQYLHLAELERRGVGDVSDRARRTWLGTATDAAKFKWRFRSSMRCNKRLAVFASRFPAFALSAGTGALHERHCIRQA